MCTLPYVVYTLPCTLSIYVVMHTCWLLVRCYNCYVHCVQLNKRDTYTCKTVRNYNVVWTGCPVLFLEIYYRRYICTFLAESCKCTITCMHIKCFWSHHCWWYHSKALVPCTGQSPKAGHGVCICNTRTVASLS